MPLEQHAGTFDPAFVGLKTGSNANKELRARRDLYIQYRYFKGHSLQDIAKDLQCTEDNIGRIIRRMKLPKRYLQKTIKST